MDQKSLYKTEGYDANYAGTDEKHVASTLRPEVLGGTDISAFYTDLVVILIGAGCRY